LFLALVSDPPAASITPGSVNDRNAGLVLLFILK
jgi:hypothetical protein